MSLMRPLKILTILSVAALINGCFGNTPVPAPGLGSSSKVVDTISVQSISRVYLLPIVGVTGSGDNLGVDDSATVELWRDINSGNLFAVVPMDSVESYIRKLGKFDSSMAFSIADSMSANAILIANIRYSKADMGLTNVADATIQLVGAKTHKLIAYSLYNTYISNSYFLPPSFQTVRTDAIDGAAHALAKAIHDAERK